MTLTRSAVRAFGYRGAKCEEVGKRCDFWPISRCISLTVRDRA